MKKHLNDFELYRDTGFLTDNNDIIASYKWLNELGSIGGEGSWRFGPQNIFDPPF